MTLQLVYNPFTNNFDWINGGGTGGATLTEETPAGTVDGSNTIFTVVNTPIYIVVDGLTRILVSDINDLNGNGFTFSSGTIIVNPNVPPTSFIRSYFNAT